MSSSGDEVHLNPSRLYFCVTPQKIFTHSADLFTGNNYNLD